MITLPTLRIADAEQPAAAGRAAPGEAADGFLALLGDALAAGDAGKSPAQERAALKGKPRPEAELADGKQAPADDPQILTAAQPLLRPAVSAAAETGARRESPAPGDKAGDENEPMAALGALLAMLPPVTPPPAPAHAAPEAAAPAQPAGGRAAAAERPGITLAAAGAGATSAGPQAQPANAEAQTIAVAQPAAPAPAAADASPVAAPPVPVISAATATVNTHPVVTVNAQLGTPEWQQSVSQHITLFTRQGQHSAELKLHPQDLGQVTISMKLEDNQAQLQMVSGHGHVRAALEAALPQLRSQLADSGIQLTQSSISSDTSGGQQQSAFQQPSRAHFAEGNGFAADDDGDNLSAPAALQARARGDGAVDTFA